MTHISSPVQLLTVSEAAAALKVSEGWLRKGILNRTVPFTKIGRNVRFTDSHLEQIIAAGERTPTRQPDRQPGRGSARTKL